MTDIRQLLDLLQDTEQISSTIEQAVRDRPNDEILRINAESVAKRQADLIRRLDYSLKTHQNEVVRYHVLRDWSDTYPVKAIAASILAFQELVTAIFDALRSSPKQRYRPSADNVQLSTFDFAGASAGSVIISMSVPNDRLLSGETELDRTFSYVERALSARESDDLQILARDIGIASISKAYAWADVSTSYGLDTMINWGKGLQHAHSFHISRSDAESVRELIAAKSDTTSIPLELDCVLLGFDGATSYFHIETLDTRNDIRGDVSPDLPKRQTTGQMVRAGLLKNTALIYATGEEKVSWTLLSIEPLGERMGLSPG
jgi:hypothetical protein